MLIAKLDRNETKTAAALHLLQNRRNGAVSYRPICPSDEEQLRVLHASLFPIDYEQQFYTRVTRGYDNIFGWVATERSMEAGRSLDEVVGFVTARLAPIEEADPQDCMLMEIGYQARHVVYLLTIGTHPRLQRQGIAMDLLKLVQYRAVEQVAAVMYLHVAAYNDAAIAFYSRHGFRRAALLKGFYSITSERRPQTGAIRYDAILFYLGLDTEQRFGWGELVGLKKMAALLSGCLPWVPRHKNGLYLGHSSSFTAVVSRTSLHPLRQIFGT